MKYIEKYIEEELRIKPLGEVTLEDDILDNLSGNYIKIGGKFTGIFVSDVDYANWLETKVNL